MDILSWIKSLPNNPSLDRDRAILNTVRNGLVVYQWIPIVSSTKNHTAIFWVCDDAIRVEDANGNRFRFQVSATLAQQCADLMRASLITSKIGDLSYQQAKIIINAVTLPPGSDMATTSKSKQWNTLVESKRAGRLGLFRDCGKTWILSNKLNAQIGAINYGFYDKRAPYIGPGGIKMWQTIGTKHNRYHTDYSQTLILMRNTCEINGNCMQIVDVMKDKDLAPLLSYEGILHFIRQPGT